MQSTAEILREHGITDTLSRCRLFEQLELVEIGRSADDADDMVQANMLINLHLRAAGFYSQHAGKDFQAASLLGMWVWHLDSIGETPQLDILVPRLRKQTYDAAAAYQKLCNSDPETPSIFSSLEEYDQAMMMHKSVIHSHFVTGVDELLYSEHEDLKAIEDTLSYAFDLAGDSSCPAFDQAFTRSVELYMDRFEESVGRYPKIRNSRLDP